MKAEELMIGDWVHYTDKHQIYQEIDAQVVALRRDGKIQVDWKHGDGCTMTVINQGWAFKPIPLTPEILEKNGFEYLKTGEAWYLKEHEQKPIYIKRHQQGKWTVNINCNILPCVYYFVHQIQHILKDCGINKEIKV